MKTFTIPFGANLSREVMGHLVGKCEAPIFQGSPQFGSHEPPAIGWVREVRTERDGFVADIEVTDEAAERIMRGARIGLTSIGMSPSWDERGLRDGVLEYLNPARRSKS